MWTVLWLRFTLTHRVTHEVAAGFLQLPEIARGVRHQKRVIRFICTQQHRRLFVNLPVPAILVVNSDNGRFGLLPANGTNMAQNQCSKGELKVPT